MYSLQRLSVTGKEETWTTEEISHTARGSRSSAITPFRHEQGEIGMSKRIIWLAVLLALWVNLAPAQTITASITGTATDPSSAVIAGGTVIATNAETNVQTTSRIVAMSFCEPRS